MPDMLLVSRYFKTLLDLAKRPAPEPVPGLVEIVETYDGYLFRLEGTDLYCFVESHTQREQWRPRSFGERFWKLRLSDDLDVARNIRNALQAHRNSRAAYDAVVERQKRERAVFVEKVVS